MKLNMYSIYDKAAQAFNTPFFMHNKGLAMRAFEDNINSKEENNISKHPEHFSLYCVGEYDDSTGMVQPNSEPELVSTALELVQPTEESKIEQKLDAVIKMLNTGE